MFLLLLAALLLSPVTALAVTERPILPSGKGPQRLAADAELVGGSADGSLSDLRLRDGSGREIPYLLVSPETPEGIWRPARILPIAATKSASGFELDLGKPLYTGRLRVSELPEPFLKRCRLEGSGDRQHWTLLVEQGTLFSLPDERLRQLEMAFPEGEYRYLRVTWDDRMSPRLPLPKSAAAYLLPTGAPPPPSTTHVAFSRRTSEPGVSRFRLRLPGSHLPVRAIELTVGGGHLMREARVLQAILRESELVPMVLGQAQLRRVVRNDVTASEMRIPIETPAEPELELRVEDGNNPPLDLEGVTAELVPLPWIYFESPDGASITARYGDRRLTRPQYDLEAVRGELKRLHPVDARWGSARAGPPPLVPDAPQADPGPGAPVVRSEFKYARAVPTAQPGLAALLLDAEVLTRSPSLADLRIADAQGRQVQYLLEHREEPLSIALSLSPAGTKNGTSTYTLPLPFSDLPAARLVIETTGRVFERYVAAYEKIPAERPGERRRHRRGSEEQHRLLADTTWRHSSPDEAAPALVLDLPPLTEHEIQLRVDEGDNSPLPLRSPRLLLPTYRLRFFHPGSELTLLYGNSEAQKPRYDLALLEPRLRGAAAQEIELAQAAAPGRVEALEPVVTMNKLFWIALVAAMVVLFLLLGKLLKKGPPTGAK